MGDQQTSDPIAEVQRIIDGQIASGQRIRVLEAGCGSMSKVRLGPNAEVVGVDVSVQQLARNQGLHERILGDIQTYALPARSFDIIICWDVLEHLPSPRLAILNFFTAVKPDGLIILAFPNLYSLKGVITKFTPHFVHILYYKYLLRIHDAGRNDTPPFVTYLRSSATCPAIRRLASRHRTTIAFLALRESYDMRYVRENYRFIGWLIRIASSVSRLVSFGRVDVLNSDCIVVLRARAAGT